jgi:hypothetical protein
MKMKKIMLLLIIFVSMFLLPGCDLLDTVESITNDGDEYYNTAIVDDEVVKFNQFLEVTEGNLGITLVKGASAQLTGDYSEIRLYFEDGQTGELLIDYEVDFSNLEESFNQAKTKASYVEIGLNSENRAYFSTTGKITIITNDETIVEGTYEFEAQLLDEKKVIREGRFKLSKI